MLECSQRSIVDENWNTDLFEGFLQSIEVGGRSVSRGILDRVLPWPIVLDRDRRGLCHNG